MNILAWLLFLVALVALAMTWLIGQGQLQTAVAAERHALEQRREQLKTEKDRFEAKLAKQREAYVKLETEIDELKEQISATNTEIAKLQASLDASDGESLDRMEMMERSHLIETIAALRNEIHRIKQELDDLKANR
jgi:chromosome segregation ATPase